MFVLVSCHCNKILETIQPVRMKGLFWLMTSEVSVHGHMVPLPLGLWLGSTSQWERVVEEVAHSWQLGNIKETGSDWGSNIPFKGTPPVTQLPRSRLYFFKGSTTSQ
jgi:hypothetical protein